VGVSSNRLKEGRAGGQSPCGVWVFSPNGDDGVRKKMVVGAYWMFLVVGACRERAFNLVGGVLWPLPATPPIISVKAPADSGPKPFSVLLSEGDRVFVNFYYCNAKKKDRARGG